MFLEQFSKDKGQLGSIEVICGSMFSGKTEELFRRLRRAQFANQAILLVKPLMKIIIMNMYRRSVYKPKRYFISCANTAGQKKTLIN